MQETLSLVKKNTVYSLKKTVNRNEIQYFIEKTVEVN